MDFAGNPAAVSAVAEALRLAHGHQFNPAFAAETARIDPLAASAALLGAAQARASI